VSLRMLTNLRLADLPLTTAQQRSAGKNLPSDLYRLYGTDASYSSDESVNTYEKTELVVPLVLLT
jgi:hypothetical protein